MELLSRGCLRPISTDLPGVGLFISASLTHHCCPSIVGNRAFGGSVTCQRDRKSAGRDAITTAVCRHRTLIPKPETTNVPSGADRGFSSPVVIGRRERLEGSMSLEHCPKQRYRRHTSYTLGQPNYVSHICTRHISDIHIYIYM